MLRRTLLAISLLSILALPPAQAAGAASAFAKHEPPPKTCLIKTETGKQIVKKKREVFNDESPIKIAPHRALYTMSLATAKNSSNITGVSGRMIFEWSDDCEGWAVQQHLQLRFAYAEGDESDVNSAVLSWEAKDGSRYNFNVRRITNGKETERYRGRATVDGDGGLVKYAVPQDKTDKTLVEKTLYPSAHTKLILEKALEGEQFFTRRVFDGSDEDGESDVSAFISAPVDKPKQEGMSETLLQSPLLQAKTWPVRLAFFKPDSETGESDYEMDLMLQENGVARSMRIDYGDFSVTGELSSIEPLPASGCSE